jgi:GNAT superfamily N-acetyltransferase
VGRAVVRDAGPPDAPAIAGVHVRAWQAAYRGLLPDDFLDALRPEDRASRYELGSRRPGSPRTIVALIDDAIVGFATIGPSRDADAAEAGELRALYVDPSCWRDGVGRRLLLEARAGLHAAGYREALLWVLLGNEPAERFYRSDGWRADGARREEDPWGVTAQVLRYRRMID